MIGTVDDIRLTHGGFGEQYTTIDGERYVTYFDFRNPRLAGLKPGCRVQFESRPGPTRLCGVPDISARCGSATLIQVING